MDAKARELTSGHLRRILPISALTGKIFGSLVLLLAIVGVIYQWATTTSGFIHRLENS